MAFASFQERESGTSAAPQSAGQMAGQDEFVKQIPAVVGG